METGQFNSEQATKSEKSHERSASYPALSLDEAIEFTNSVYKSFTKTAVKREEYARVVDVHPNSLSRQFGACTQFSLLEKTPDGYKVSMLFDRIINPENSKDKKIAKLEAFGSPKIYKELIDKFDGRYIEPELPNTLIKHHNITAKAAPEAADTFIKSAQQAEAMSENRVLKFRDTLNSTQKITGYAEVYEEPKPNNEEQKEDAIKLFDKKGQLIPIPNHPNLKTMPIHLTNDKEAYFAYPPNMSSNDVKLVEHNIQGILMRIKFEADEREQNKNPAEAG